MGIFAYCCSVEAGSSELKRDVGLNDRMQWARHEEMNGS
jgi:hypothetical protein